MTSPLQLLLVVVIVFLTLLLGFVAFQTVALIIDFRKTLKRVNQELDGTEPHRPSQASRVPSARPVHPTIRRFFRRAGLPLRAS